MKRLLELDVTVLRTRSMRETDRLVEVISAEQGRVSLLARGGRASKRRFPGALDLFVTLHAHVETRGSLWSLTAAHVLDARIGIRTDLGAFQRASLIVGTVAALTPERQAATRMYKATNLALDRLTKGQLAEAAECYPRLLEVAGILPNLRRCARCGRQDPPLGQVNASAGTALCPACSQTDEILSPALATALRGGPCRDPNVASQLEDVVASWVESYLGKPLKVRSAENLLALPR